MSKKIIFVDFFDTLMMRYIHPFEIEKKLAELVIYKFDLDISANEFIALRKATITKLSTEKCYPTYDDLMSEVYNTVVKHNNTLNKKQFIDYCEKAEFALETAVQYPNSKLVHFLKKKKSHGSKIYIVSDFHLSGEKIKAFCHNKGIDTDLFDDIFVSSDFNAKKFDGTLYRKVLKKIGCDARDAIMIGDNPLSDYRMAKSNNIKPYLFPRVFHKLILKLKFKVRYDFSKHATKKIAKNSYKYSLPFSEYASVYFSFTERLDKKLTAKSKPVFLAREGYFLKALFDEYQYLLKKQENIIPSEYFLCSRRAIASVNLEEVNTKIHAEKIPLKYCLYTAGFTDEEIELFQNKFCIDDEQIEQQPEEPIYEILKEIIPLKIESNQKALADYAKTIISTHSADTPVHFIDIGWNGSMQKGIENFFNIKTKGFYVGTTGDSVFPETNGLVFSYKESLEKQTYYGLLSTNRQLYESLASAPHGSAQCYTYQGGELSIPLRWVENEKQLYEQTIENWQRNAIEWFCALTIWSDKNRINITNKQNAYTVMKSALFANRQRRDFTRELDKGFVWNFGQDVKGIDYKKSYIKINLSVFFKPENYLHYFAKLQRLLPENSFIQALYYCFAFIVSLYIKTVLKIKGAK